jgi:hypothetical protein
MHTHIHTNTNTCTHTHAGTAYTLTDTYIHKHTHEHTNTYTHMHIFKTLLSSARATSLRQLVVIGFTVFLLRFGLNNLMQTLAKFSLSPVQWDKTKLYYLLREVRALCACEMLVHTVCACACWGCFCVLCVSAASRVWGCGNFQLLGPLALGCGGSDTHAHAHAHSHTIVRCVHTYFRCINR